MSKPTNMDSAPRDGTSVRLKRYPDGDGGPKEFIGRWNEQTARWEDLDGVFRPRVYEWKSLPNAQNPATGSTSKDHE